MSRNVRLPERPTRESHALPPEPSARGKARAFGALLAALAFLLMTVAVLLLQLTPRVTGPIVGALS